MTIRWHAFACSILALLVLAGASVVAGAPSADDDHPLNRNRQRDAFENNYSPASAAVITVGAEVQANFVCPVLSGCAGPDQDFYALAVKAGACYRIATEQLAAGVDTNLILFDTKGATLLGNDDRAPGEAASSVEYCARENMRLVILVGPTTPPPEPHVERTYVLRTAVFVPPTVVPPTRIPPTAVPPTRVPPTAQTAPVAPTTPPISGGVPRQQPPPVVATNPPSTEQAVPTSISPAPAPTVVVPLDVRVEEIQPSTAPAATTVPLRVVDLSFRACWDANENGACDLDEGIVGLTGYASDAVSGALLGQALTDEQGMARLAVEVPETTELLISIPYVSSVQTTTARAPHVDPVIIRTVPAIPAVMP